MVWGDLSTDPPEAGMSPRRGGWSGAFVSPVLCFAPLERPRRRRREWVSSRRSRGAGERRLKIHLRQLDLLKLFLFEN
jgi:hypothetical protein